MQPFGQIPAFEDGDLKLFGKVYMKLMTNSSFTLLYRQTVIIFYFTLLLDGQRRKGKLIGIYNLIYFNYFFIVFSLFRF
jgi:hypothetical protein